MILIPKPRYRVRLHGTLPSGTRDTWLIENDDEDVVLKSVKDTVYSRDLSGICVEDLNDTD